jgi:hypothetical protein
MQKVQGQKPALEETRNSKVIIYFSFIYLQSKQIMLGSIFNLSSLKKIHRLTVLYTLQVFNLFGWNFAL